MIGIGIKMVPLVYSMLCFNAAENVIVYETNINDPFCEAETHHNHQV